MIKRHRASSWHILAAVAASLLLSGCTRLDEDPEGQSAAHVTQPTAAAPGTAGPPAGQAVGGMQPLNPNVPSPGAASAAAAQQDPVELSAGTALPLTLPDGTGMGFSVDYKVEQYPADSGQAVWVIERKDGEPARIEKTLEAKGTFETLIPGWHPEHGPFQSWIEWVAPDGGRRAISDKEPLR